MRDPNRIDSFVVELGKIWKDNCPDWRFGQFLVNVFRGTDPFYLEDERFIRIASNYFSQTQTINKTKQKTKQKLFLDFDGVIVDTIQAIVSLYNKDFLYYKGFKKIKAEDVKTWDFEECSLASKEYINRYFNQKRFFDALPVMNSASYLLMRLTTKYEVYVVTMGYSPNLIGKEIWLKENFPNVKMIGVNMKEYEDKSHIDMSGGIFIDDSAVNLETSNADVKICFGKKYPWNEKWEGIRCQNWYEVESYLDKNEKYRT